MIRGSVKSISSSKMEHVIEMSIHNRFDIEVIDAKTGKVKQTAQAFNCICNKLWDYLLQPKSYFN